MKTNLDKQFEHKNTDSSPLPWYKQKWPWLIMSLPFLTIIAGIITYNIAANKPASLVNDDYFKEGLAINKSLGRQRIARELGLIAEFSVDTESKLLTINLKKNAANLKKNTNNNMSAEENSNLISSHLILSFSHPTQQKHDKKIQLSPITETEFVAELPEIVQADWHINLRDNSDLWEIKSRWLYPQNQSLLIDTNN